MPEVDGINEPEVGFLDRIAKYKFLIAAIFISTIAVSINMNTSIWADEGFTICFSSLSIKEIFEIVASYDSHPPLYYLFLHFWQNISLETPFLRLPSYISLIFSIYFVYLIAKKLYGERHADLTALLVGASFFVVTGVMQIRMFCLLTCFSLASIYFYYCIIMQEGTRIRVLLYLLFSILAIYTNYLAIFLLLAQLLNCAIMKRWDLFKHIFFLQLVIFCCFMPWLPVLYCQFISGAGPCGVFNGDLLKVIYDIVYIFRSTMFGVLSEYNGHLSRTVNYILLLPIFLIFLAPIVYQPFKHKDRLLVTLFSIFFLFILTFSIFRHRNVIQIRYFIFLMPLWFAAMSDLLLLAHDRKKWIFVFFMLLFLGFNLSSLYVRGTNPYYSHQNWKQAIEEANIKENDCIVVEDQFQIYTIKYYLRDLGESYYMAGIPAPTYIDGVLNDIKKFKCKKVWLFNSMSYDLVDPKHKMFDRLNSYMTLKKALKYDNNSQHMSVKAYLFEKESK